MAKITNANHEKGSLSEVIKGADVFIGPDTLYFTPIEANSSVTLGLMPANAYYQRTGFDSADAAKSGLKLRALILAEIDLQEFMSMVLRRRQMVAGTVKVTSAAGQYGPASLHIVNKNNTSAGIDMTVYVEAAETQKDVTVSNVEVKDLSGDNVIAEDKQNLTVSAAAKEADNPF